MCKSGLAVHGIQATGKIVRVVAIPDGETVQKGVGVGVVSAENMHAVICLGTRVTYFSTEDGGVGNPIALVQAGFGARKSAIHGHSGMKGKEAIPICG